MNTVSMRLVMATIAWCAVWHFDAAGADGPLSHSVYQQVSPPDRYNLPAASSSLPPARSTSNPFSSPPANYPSSFAPPPGVVDSARNAATDASNALRQGVESGIRQANEQFPTMGSQFVDSARNAGQGLNTQLQEFAGSAGRQLEQTGDAFRNTAEQSIRMAAGGQAGSAPAVSGFAEPPWTGAAGASTAPLFRSATSPPPSGTSASPFAPVSTGSPGNFSSPTSSNTQNPQREVSVLSTNSNWSVLGRDVPAPPLLTPSLAAFDPRAASAPMPPIGAAPAASSSPFDLPPFSPPSQNTNVSTQGPNNLPPAGQGRGAIHSSLSDPGPPGAPAGRFDFGSPPAGNSRDMSAAFPSPNDAATGRDPFGQPPILGPPNAPANNARSNAPVSFDAQDRSGFAAGGPNGPNSAGASNPFLNSASGPQSSAPAAGQLLTIGTNPAAGANRAGNSTIAQRQNADATQSSDPSVQKPWLPLVLTVLGLVGSLSANFFLGWSYVDARHKYQSLVRKTADKFRRAADAA